jgi:hypothetical protein
MVATFIIKSEAFMREIFSNYPKQLFRMKRNSSFIITPLRLRFRPMGLYFGACRGDSGKESSEKYRVIAPRVVDSDLLDHRRIEHVFASRVRVRGQYQRQHSDDCPLAGTLVSQFLTTHRQA